MEVNQYKLHAITYPAIISMVIPFLLTYMYVVDLPIELWATWTNIEKILGIFVPTAIVFSALGYFVKELFRSTSKVCFQNILYNEDETLMPTTEFLLWRTNFMAKQEKEKVRAKLLAEENYQMLAPEQELANETEARLNIVGAVKIIRQRTWGHPVLTQYNYQYGFWRNLMGGLFWDLLFVVVLAIINYKVAHLDYRLLVASALVIVFVGIVSCFVLKNNAKVYARHLFPIYLTK